MKLSKMGFKNIKLTNLDEMYPAQDILIKTGQIKQYGSGIYAFDNIPLRVRDNVEKIIKKYMDEIDCVETEMPLLQLDKIWKRSNRYESYISDGTMMEAKTDKENYCLAPTAEEAITVFIENRVNSYKQLPVAMYQIGTKFRNEIRNRGYLFRGKEFIMFDLYSFDENEEGMIDAYTKVKEAYFKVFKELGLELVVVAADNGSMGGKKSEEIMVLSEVGEDKVLYDEETKQGLNTEILEREDAEKYLKNEYGINDVSKLKEFRAMELGHIFALGTEYSETMNIKYIDNNNELQPFYMGCYGIGVSRVLGLIYENNIIKENDKVIGFSLPLCVSPYCAYIISSNQKTEEAEKIYKNLTQKGINVIIDDNEKTLIGEKIRTAKVLGIPYMIIIGNNTENGFVEIEETKNSNKEIITYEELEIKLLNN